MFKDAATALPNYINAEQNWPKYALVMHAIELALKSLWQHANDNGADHGPYPKHDLIKLYTTCRQCGLPNDASEAEWIVYLSHIHSNHYTRYPQQQNVNVTDLSNGPDYVAENLVSAVTQLINSH